MKKKRIFFSVETLVLRYRQEIASLTVSRLHVSNASQVLCGFSAHLPVRGSIPVERTSPFIGKQGSNANSLSLSSSHRPVMSEILLNGCQKVHRPTMEMISGAPLLGAIVDYQY